TLYLGGGTPSLLNPAEFATVAAHLPSAVWAEATVEAAPGDADADRIRAWATAGIDRVSFGVQSFNPLVASRAGRKHSPEVIEREVAGLRAAGIHRINIDLIAGLAYQTWESWRT